MNHKVKCTCGEQMYPYIKLEDFKNGTIKHEDKIKCSKCKKVWKWSCNVKKNTK